MAEKRPIRLIQLGDMYELWWGLDWFCTATPDCYESVELARPGRFGEDPALLVQAWVEQTRRSFPQLVERLEGHEGGLPCTLLPGNHDQYLGRPDCRPSWMAPRLPEYRFNGLYVEHGHNHRADPFNRDGSRQGYEGATKYFFDHNLVHLAPLQRRLHLASAVRQFCEKPDFSVYVMGHTHSPFLTRIQIGSFPHYPTHFGEKKPRHELSGADWWHAHQAEFSASARHLRSGQYLGVLRAGALGASVRNAG